MSFHGNATDNLLKITDFKNLILPVHEEFLWPINCQILSNFKKEKLVKRAHPEHWYFMGADFGRSNGRKYQHTDFRKPIYLYRTPVRGNLLNHGAGSMLLPIQF